MASFNKVFLMGNLTRDPELRYTPSGTPVAKIGLAVNRRWKDKTGEQKEEVCFVTVVAWNKLAEICNQYLHKGRLVFVEGRLQYRSWEDNAGQKRSVIEVMADQIQFLGQGQAAAGTTQRADRNTEYSPDINTESQGAPAGVEAGQSTVAGVQEDVSWIEGEDKSADEQQG